MATCLRIDATLPSLKSSTSVFFGESCSFRAIISAPSHVSTYDIQVEMFSNIKDAKNIKGDWIARSMYLEREETNPADNSKRLVFCCVVLPTGEGNFEATARVRLGEHGEWQWAGQYQQNAYMNVWKSIHHEWARGPRVVEILPNLFLGNLIAACNASRYGFEAVLNVAEECDVCFPDGLQGIHYKKIPIVDGANRPIPQPFVEEALRWVDANRDRRVLIHCRAAKFRSASIMVAVIYKMLVAQGGFTYEDAVRFLMKRKPDIMPHNGLADTLHRIFPAHGTSSHLPSVPLMPVAYASNTRAGAAPAHAPPHPLERQR